MQHAQSSHLAKVGARDSLRSASDAAHQRMHGLEPFAAIAAGTLPVSGYGRLLQSLFRFHAAVAAQTHAAGLTRLSGAQRRLDLLSGDLDCLGASVPPSAIVRRSGPREAALGALYVAQGSVFGGRVIAGQLDYVFGSEPDGRRFFIGDRADGSDWAQLLEIIEVQCAEPKSLAVAIGGALATFALFERCVVQRD